MRTATPETIPTAETDVPARLERLPWAGFHWLVLAALGISWVLDGLEVTLVGSISPALTQPTGLGLSDSEVGDTASAYLVGAVLGSIFFGWLTDRLGRKALFTWTVLVYVVATIASGFAWNFWTLALCRMVTGFGIGGEYAAVNATIQELIPARFRGFAGLVVDGSYWLGAALGGVGARVVLDPRVLSPEIGWRAAFIVGGLIGITVLILRRKLPESPRWQMTHGQVDAAEANVAEIERRVERETGRPLPPDPHKTMRIRTDKRTWFRESFTALIGEYRRRTILGVTLMAAQAFCYNAVLFTYALVLTEFFHIDGADAGLYMIPFALGNFLGPLLLGRLFDTVGRKPMIASTYILGGALMAGTGWMFAQGWLTANTLMAAWTVTFFFASAAASAAYVVVGESFPLEVRAVAIALFFAFGTLVGGVSGPLIFGRLIETRDPFAVFEGHLIAAALMAVAGVAELFLGVAAENKTLEEIATPLSVVE